jgi:hypothetical protein
MISEMDYGYEEIKTCLVCKMYIEKELVKCERMCFHKRCLIHFLKFKFCDDKRIISV